DCFTSRKTEPRHGIGHLFWLDNSFLWIHGAQLGSRFGLCASGFCYDAVDGPLQHLRLRVSGADSVDCDALGRDFERERTCKSDHAMLSRAVCRNVAIALESGSAGDVYDASPAGLKHGRQNSLNAVKNAIQIHLHHAAPESDIGLHEGSRTS